MIVSGALDLCSTEAFPDLMDASPVSEGPTLVARSWFQYD